MQLMIPLILVSQNKTNINKYLQKQFPKTQIINLQPEKTEYSINQIRAIITETITLKPNLRVYYFESFDNSSLEAQNAFLKILEEPPSNIQFILSTFNEYKLIPTIRSRSRIVHLVSRSSSKINDYDLFNKIIKKNIAVLNDKYASVSNKEQAIEQIDDLISTLRPKTQSDHSATKALNECLKTRKLLEENNINPQLSLDHLLIFISKLYSIKI